MIFQQTFKKGFFKKIGVFILITIISLLIIGEKNIDNTAIKVIKTIQNGIDEVKEIRNSGNTDFKQNIYDTYVDKVLSELFEGNNDGLVKAVREDKSIGKGVTVAVTNFFTKGQTQVQIFINSIIGKPTQEQLNKAVAIILAVVAILLKIFIINPLNISIARMYLESKSYKVKFGRLKYAFNKEYYLNIVKSAIVLDIYKNEKLDKQDKAFLSGFIEGILEYDEGIDDAKDLKTEMQAAIKQFDL